MSTRPAGASPLQRQVTLATTAQSLSFLPRMVEASLLSLGSVLDRCLNAESVQSSVCVLHSFLRSWGVPRSMHPSAEMICVWCTATSLTLFNYYIVFGNRHMRRRLQLKKDLGKTHDKMQELEEKLLKLGAEELVQVQGKDQIR